VVKGVVLPDRQKDVGFFGWIESEEVVVRFEKMQVGKLKNEKSWMSVGKGRRCEKDDPSLFWSSRTWLS
jgi:hypothetical protein